MFRLVGAFDGYPEVTGLFAAELGQLDADLLEVQTCDFLVEFLPLHEGEHADAYFGLLEGLQALFGRSVDLVMTVAVRNPYFLEAVAGSREVVYAA